MAKTALERKTEASVRERTLVMVRRYQASPKQLFEAWTNERELAQWIGPKNMTVPMAKSEPREGGRYRITMRSAEGKDFIVSGQFCEMRAGERIVMTWAWEEEGGHGPVTCVTIELKPSGKSTEMRFHHALFADKEGRASHRHGWEESLDKLTRHFKSRSLN
jgi:uncharacterized protein YndB with AHSA1/START domain